MFNKRSTILILLTILCIGLTISSVSAIDNSQPADNLTVDESSTDQLGSVHSMMKMQKSGQHLLN